MFGNSRHPALAASVHAPDIGPAQATRPEGIAAEHPRAKMVAQARTGILEDVQGGSQKQIDADRGELLADHRTYRLGVGIIPGRTQSHAARQLGEAVAHGREGMAVAFL